MAEEHASVRYIVDDVDAAGAFYTEQLGFEVLSRPAPAFADVDDLDAHLARLRSTGAMLRSEVVEGPGGRQFLVADPAGDLVEVFEPAG